MSYSYGYNCIFKATSFWVGALLPHMFKKIIIKVTLKAAEIFLHLIILQIKEKLDHEIKTEQIFLKTLFPVVHRVHE